MKLTYRFCALFLAAAPVVWAQGPAPAPKPALPALALHFEKVALGNVLRVISAKFNVPITITSNATTGVSGDFANLTLEQALDQAARQAGLVVVALGKTQKEGFSLDLPTPGKEIDAGARSQPGLPEEKAALAAAAERRAELLKKRKALTDQQAQPAANPAARASEAGHP
jgi:hypothetical protein